MGGRPLRVRGIIPANTGRIKFNALSVFAEKDHPREYGENRIISFIASTSVGSSPRIRGECNNKTCSWSTQGIIPANTGRIKVDAWRRYAESDHPREYGENLTIQVVLEQHLGSSPRIRGEFQRCQTCTRG